MAFRAIEICDVEWSQVEFGRTATLHVRRAKNGKPAAHPLRGDEGPFLRELKRQTEGGFVFETERGGPFTPDAVSRLIKRVGSRARFPFQVHAHAWLFYALANKGHGHASYPGFLGLHSIQHTARYTGSRERFKNFWRGRWPPNPSLNAVLLCRFLTLF